MKNKSTLLLNAILMTLIFCGKTIIVKSQCFFPATITELTSQCVLNSFPRSNTGNDSRTASYGAYPDWIEVNVFDGIYPAISYNDGIPRCNIDLPANIYDPDIVLIESGSMAKWYAIVVYANSNNNCVCDLYEYDLATSKFNQVQVSGYPYILKSTHNQLSQYSTTINIDADENGNFCIVWDDALTGNIMAHGGYANLSTNPGLPALSSNPAIIASGSNLRSPDVSLMSRGCPFSNCLSRAHITFVEDGGYDLLRVINDNFEDWILGSGPTLTYDAQVYDPSNSNTLVELFIPRIACPIYDPTENKNDEYTSTVVIEIFNHTNGTSDVIGFTRVKEFSHPPSTGIYYTDGSQLACAINNDSQHRNLLPVITYANSLDKGFVISWVSEYSQSNLIIPGIVALECNLNGQVSCGHDYLIVHSTNNGKNDAPSLSGRDAKFSTYWGISNNPIQYSFVFHEASLEDVLYKDVEFSTCALRLKNSKKILNQEVSYNLLIDDNTNILQANLNVPLSLTICNTLGTRLYFNSGDSNILNENVQQFCRQLPSGIYFLKMISPTIMGKIKIIKP